MRLTKLSGLAWILSATIAVRPHGPPGPVAQRVTGAVSRVPCSSDSVANGKALQDSIDSAPPYHVVHMGPCVYFRPSAYATVRIRNKTGLTVEGEGDASVVRVDRKGRIGVEIQDTVHELTLRRFRIAGPADTLPVLYGVTSQQNAPNNPKSVSKVRIIDLTIQDVSVGIDVGSGPDGSYDSVSVLDNRILRAYAAPETPNGSGYGILNAHATRVVIAGNEIVDAGRHSIYQGQVRRAATPAGDVWIHDNLVLDHGKTASASGTMPDYLVAVPIARSPGIVVSNNLIINSRTWAMSIEEEEHGAIFIRDVSLINNTFLGTRSVDVWIQAATEPASAHRIYGWGNRSGRRSTAASTSVTGNPLPEPPYWAGTLALAQSPGGSLFAMRGGHVHRVGLDAGTLPNRIWPYISRTTYLDTQWDSAGFQAAAATDDDHVFVMQNGTLYGVPVGPFWLGSPPTPVEGWQPFLTSSGGYLYAIGRDSLLRKLDANLKVVAINTSTRWFNTQMMASWKDRVYVMQNDCVHLINTQTLNYDWHECL